MNLFSFCLYGTDELYIQGAIRNAEHINTNLPNWKSMFFVSATTSKDVINQLLAHDAKVQIQTQDWHLNGMFWRFSAFLNGDYDYIAIRDTDSRITFREIECIQEWIDSGKSAHIIRDHPLHRSLVMGGMWGCRQKLLANPCLWGDIKNYGLLKGEDQVFLNQVIYPLIVNDSLIHDSYFSFENFSKEIRPARMAGEFIGEVYDENDEPVMSGRDFLLDFEKSRVRKAFVKYASRYYKF